MYRKIVVCIDDSPLSERVARTGADLACRYDADIILLSVLDIARLPTQPYTGLEAIELLDRHTRTLSDTTQRLSVMLHDQGVRNRQMLLQGRSAETILQAAAAESADLIVLGTEARGRFNAWLNSDIWSEVSHKAPCHVLRVTPPTEAEQKRLGSKRVSPKTSLLTTSLSAL